MFLFLICVEVSREEKKIVGNSVVTVKLNEHCWYYDGRQPMLDT